MNRETWLIAIGAGRWQVHGITAARAAGLNVLAVDASPTAPGLAAADRALVADIRDIEAVATGIFAAGVAPAGAIAFCNEAGMRTAALLRDWFDLPGPGSRIATALTRKDQQRALWTKAGLPGPRWRVVRTMREAAVALRSLGGACIMKPVDSAGSRGVTVIEPGAPWRDAFAQALALSASGNVIIEDFVVGVEHTIETFSHAGHTEVLAITAKQKVPGTSNTVASELATATLPPEELRAMGDTVARALAALGYTDGPGHTEMLRTMDGELFLVESAGRGGGFMVAEGIVPAVSGFDLATACALQAVGRTPPALERHAGRASVLRFVPSRAGRVTSIAGFGPEDEVPGVRSEPLVALGQEVGRAASDGDRMAYILATASTTYEALRLADEKEQRIRIDIAA